MQLGDKKGFYINYPYLNKGDEMISWWLVAAIVLIAILFLKFKEIRHKIMTVLMIGLVLFLALSIARVFISNDVDLSSFEGVTHAGKIYFAWLGGFASNLGKISGFAIKQDWAIERDAEPATNSTVK